jgi:hypothetical protein
MIRKIALGSLLMFVACDQADLDDEGPDYIDETTPAGKADGDDSVVPWCHAAAVKAVGQLEKANNQKVKITKVAFDEPGLFNGDYMRVTVKRASGSKWIEDSWKVHYSDGGDEEAGCEILGLRNDKRVPAALEASDELKTKITSGCRFASMKAAQRLEAQNGWSGKVTSMVAVAGGDKKFPQVEVKMFRDLATESHPDADDLFSSAYVVSTEPRGTAGCRIWGIEDLDSVYGPGVLDGGPDPEDEEE